MASNPPITTFHSNGTIDLQTRISRFLTTIEPHARFFLAQGRTHLDSLVERDKAQKRILKSDKTGWAGSVLDGTTSLVDVAAGVEGDGKGSHVSVSAMSSVSQRGGRVARMRDRHGNTAETTLKHTNARIQTITVKPKLTGGMIAPLPDTSSSPIQPWKDIRPKSPRKVNLERTVGMEPVVEIPVHSGRGDVVQGGHDEVSNDVIGKDGTSKKRKMAHVEKSERLEQEDKRKSRREGNATEKPQNRLLLVPVSDSDNVEKQQKKLRPLVDSSSRINCTIKLRDAKQKETKLSPKDLVAKTSSRQAAQQVAEDKAREEILAVRRNRRREKMALKTTSVPASKKGEKMANTRGSDGERGSDDGKNGSGRNDKQSVGNKKAGRLAAKGSTEPSLALLRAYEVSGHLDRSRRITLPTPKLRLGLFGKGTFSGRAGKKFKDTEHPPDLQFQAESFLKRKRRAISRSSSSTDANSDDDGHSSNVSHADDQKAGVPIHKTSSAKERKPSVPKRNTRKAVDNSEKAKGKVRAEQSSASSSTDGSVATEEKSTASRENGKRQTSPDWPTVLPDAEDPEEPQVSQPDRPQGFSDKGPTLTKRRGDVTAGSLEKYDPKVQDPSLLLEIANPVQSPSPAVAPPPDMALICEEKEHRNDIEHPIQQNFDTSCSPSLDARSYADMLAQALAGSISPESSNSVRPVGGFKDGNLGLSQRDGYLPKRAAEELRISEQVGEQALSEAIDYCFVGADEDGSHQESFADKNWNMDYGITDQRYQRDIDETAYPVAPFDLTSQPEPLLSVCADNPSGCLATAPYYVDEQRSDSPAQATSSSGPVAFALEVGRESYAKNAAQENDTLDIFGTDAEQARKVLYGSRAQR